MLTPPDAGIASGVAAATAARRIEVAGTFNLRDIGGYAVGTDRMTAWGKIYRSDWPGAVTADRNGWDVLGLRTVVDLRSAGERAARPTPATEPLRVLARPYGISELLNEEPELAASMSALYAAGLRRLGPELAAAVAALLEPESLPALVHCTAGKDRTGLVIALLLSSLGVADEVVAADYAVTAELLTPAFFAAVDATHVFPDGQVDLTPLRRADASVMLETLALVRELAGGARGYLEQCGVDGAGLDRLSQELVVPVP